jgi:hypothetical protein
MECADVAQLLETVHGVCLRSFWHGIRDDWPRGGLWLTVAR